jgi:hypothetical protein
VKSYRSLHRKPKECHTYIKEGGCVYEGWYAQLYEYHRLSVYISLEIVKKLDPITWFGVIEQIEELGEVLNKRWLFCLNPSLVHLKMPTKKNASIPMGI